MRRKGSTEQVVKRTAMKSEIEVGEPLEPEEVADYVCPDKEITDPIEAFGYVLQMAWEGKTAEEWFEEHNIHKWTNEKGESMLMDWSWYKVDNLIRNYINHEYWNARRAYVKKDWKEIYWRVSIKPYDSMLETPYGRIVMPIVCVDSTPMFFKKSGLLTPDQVEVYELYHNKTEDFDRLEMEKKIMADLILYSQIWTKTIEQSKDVFDRIKKECDKLGCIDSISFREWIFTINFGWRMITDSSGAIPQMVAPPFTMTIDFRNKRIECSWEHPHNLHPQPCLGWELTRIKDKCFKERDLYWLVMWMLEFGLQWTSTDAGNTDRDASYCLTRHLEQNLRCTKDNVMAIPIPFEEIMRTVCRQTPDFFLQMWSSRQWFTEMLDDENFVNSLLSVSDKDKLRVIFSTAYRSGEDRNEEKYNAMVEKYLS